MVKELHFMMTINNYKLLQAYNHNWLHGGSTNLGSAKQLPLMMAKAAVKPLCSKTEPFIVPVTPTLCETVLPRKTRASVISAVCLSE